VQLVTEVLSAQRMATESATVSYRPEVTLARVTRALNWTKSLETNA